MLSVAALNIHNILYKHTHTHMHDLDTFQQMNIVIFLRKNWWHRIKLQHQRLLRLQFQPSNCEFNRKICAVQCKGGGGSWWWWWCYCCCRHRCLYMLNKRISSEFFFVFHTHEKKICSVCVFKYTIAKKSEKKNCVKEIENETRKLCCVLDTF